MSIAPKGNLTGFESIRGVSERIRRDELSESVPQPVSLNSPLSSVLGVLKAIRHGELESSRTTRQRPRFARRSSATSEFSRRCP